MTPHAFVPVDYMGEEMLRCDRCAQFKGHPLHIQVLPGMEMVDHERETARQLQQAEEMTAELRRPLRDISAKAGRMERESPLFFGLGENPLLF